MADLVVGFAKLSRGRAAGCVSGENPLELCRLYVLPDRLGQGFGGALMRACLDRARDGGHETLWLGVWEHNGRARRFYRGWGFETVGSQVFTVGADDQTDDVMQRPVSGGAGVGREGLGGADRADDDVVAAPGGDEE